MEIPKLNEIRLKNNAFTLSKETIDELKVFIKEVQEHLTNNERKVFELKEEVSTLKRINNVLRNRIRTLETNHQIIAESIELLLEEEDN